MWLDANAGTSSGNTARNLNPDDNSATRSTDYLREANAARSRVRGAILAVLTDPRFSSNLFLIPVSGALQG